MIHCPSVHSAAVVGVVASIYSSVYGRLRRVVMPYTAYTTIGECGCVNTRRRLRDSRTLAHMLTHTRTHLCATPSGRRGRMGEICCARVELSVTFVRARTRAECDECVRVCYVLTYYIGLYVIRVYERRMFRLRCASTSPLCCEFAQSTIEGEFKTHTRTDCCCADCWRNSTANDDTDDCGPGVVCVCVFVYVRLPA